MFKRVLLFVLTNIAVIVVITILFAILESLFGLDISAAMGSYTGLLIFAAVIGFGGSFFSLAISRWIAKTFHKVSLIKEEELHKVDKKSLFVYQKVKEIADEYEIKMPEVGVFQSSDPNAFATGPSKNKSLVAVSTGLLQNMSEEEIEGVIAHEMSHVLNGDMITMTLLQGVVNTFVIFIARVVMIAIENAMDESFGLLGYILIVSILESVLMFLALPLIMGFSRYREYRADKGSAEMVGTDKMIAGLEKLKFFVDKKKDKKEDSMAAFKISSNDGWTRFFASHPSIDDRIKALQENK